MKECLCSIFVEVHRQKESAPPPCIRGGNDTFLRGLSATPLGTPEDSDHGKIAVVETTVCLLF